MADEIAQVVDLEYKGIYYLLKGTKAMITSMVSAIQALHTWQHKKWLEKPGSCSWQKIQEASEGMAPILEFPAEMFEKTIDITNDKSIKGEGFISPFERSHAMICTLKASPNPPSSRLTARNVNSAVEIKRFIL